MTSSCAFDPAMITRHRRPDRRRNNALVGSPLRTVKLGYQKASACCNDDIWDHAYDSTGEGGYHGSRYLHGESARAHRTHAAQARYSLRFRSAVGACPGCSSSACGDLAGEPCVRARDEIQPSELRFTRQAAELIRPIRTRTCCACRRRRAFGSTARSDTKPHWACQDWSEIRFHSDRQSSQYYAHYRARSSNYLVRSPFWDWW